MPDVFFTPLLPARKQTSGRTSIKIGLRAGFGARPAAGLQPGGGLWLVFSRGREYVFVGASMRKGRADKK